MPERPFCSCSRTAFIHAVRVSRPVTSSVVAARSSAAIRPARPLTAGASAGSAAGTTSSRTGSRPSSARAASSTPASAGVVGGGRRRWRPARRRPRGGRGGARDAAAGWEPIEDPRLEERLAGEDLAGVGVVDAEALALELGAGGADGVLARDVVERLLAEGQWHDELARSCSRPPRWAASTSAPARSARAPATAATWLACTCSCPRDAPPVPAAAPPRRRGARR